MENKNQTKAEQMRRHIEACNHSGLTVTDYCTQNGLFKQHLYNLEKILLMSINLILFDKPLFKKSLL